MENELAPCPKEDKLQAKLFSEEQNIGTLKRHEARQKVLDVCWELGALKQTFQRWKAKFGVWKFQRPGI
jgi:hypothetical protein